MLAAAGCGGETPGWASWLCTVLARKLGFQGAATCALATAAPPTLGRTRPGLLGRLPGPVASLFYGLLPTEAGASLENVFIHISLLSTPQGSPQDECHCTFSLPGLGTPLPTGRGHSTLRRPLAQSGSSLPPAACGATACPRVAHRPPPLRPPRAPCLVSAKVALMSPFAPLNPGPQWGGAALSCDLRPPQRQRWRLSLPRPRLKQ